MAGARFFHFMVNSFIKHILGYKHSKDGFYGKTAGYYGTVEQQGRLTLHMHMLVWIKHSLSPQEIRERILDSNSEFQKRIVEYLEGSRKGEFINGSLYDVEKTLDKNKAASEYIPATEQMPSTPINPCNILCKTCDQCLKSIEWWTKYTHTVDELIFTSNVHKCNRGCQILIKSNSDVILSY